MKDKFKKAWEKLDFYATRGEAPEDNNELADLKELIELVERIENILEQHDNTPIDNDTMNYIKALTTIAHIRKILAE